LSYRRLSQVVLEEIAVCSGLDGGVIVDSSKTAYHAGERPSALRERAGLDVYVVHLVRDPRAVVWSVVGRGSNRSLEGAAHRPVLGWLAPIAGWIRANRIAERLQIEFGASRYLLIRYEDLVANPDAQLSLVEDFLRLPAGRARTTREGHQLGGNRTRFSSTIEIRPDMEWRDRLPVLAQWLIVLVTWLPMRRYGYLGGRGRPQRRSRPFRRATSS